MNDLRIEGLSRQMQLDPITPIVGDVGTSGPQSGNSFSDMLKTTIDEVNQHQSEADTAIRELIAGRTKNIHETMLAVERAELSLKLMTQVRNKIVDAYKEVMRMQV